MTQTTLNTKTNILVFIDWFWPGYLAGGPVQSILSLANYLGKEINFKIVTTNRDLNSDKSYDGILANTWIKTSMGCEIFYAEPQSLNRQTIKKLIEDTTFDKVYINSFFSKNFSIIPLQILNKYYKDKPVILAPRGMLGDGALAIKKYKKKLFILYSKLTGLHSKVTWHATSDQEEGEIRKAFQPKNKIIKISNLPKKLLCNHAKIKQKGKLNLFFVSRISEKKNLLFALDVLSDIKDIDINFNIYGPLEDREYWGKCEQIIKAMPQNIQVIYKGSISPDEIESVLSQEHALFLPTLNENFGHAIVESLFCGCTVIISDQTPWNDLEENDAGFAISLANKQKFIDSIVNCVNLNQEAFSAKSQKAINYISKKIDLDLITNQYKTLFNESIKN